MGFELSLRVSRKACIRRGRESRTYCCLGVLQLCSQLVCEVFFGSDFYLTVFV